MQIRRATTGGAFQEVLVGCKENCIGQHARTTGGAGITLTGGIPGALLIPMRWVSGFRACLSWGFMYRPRMATKTITLKIDAYEKLREAKRGRESLTEVVLRAVIPGAAPTGKALREHYRLGGTRKKATTSAPPAACWRN
jgi:hypothetical protein